MESNGVIDFDLLVSGDSQLGLLKSGLCLLHWGLEPWVMRLFSACWHPSSWGLQAITLFDIFLDFLLSSWLWLWCLSTPLRLLLLRFLCLRLPSLLLVLLDGLWFGEHDLLVCLGGFLGLVQFPLLLGGRALLRWAALGGAYLGGAHFWGASSGFIDLLLILRLFLSLDIDLLLLTVDLARPNRGLSPPLFVSQHVVQLQLLCHFGLSLRHLLLLFLQFFLHFPCYSGALPYLVGGLHLG